MMYEDNPCVPWAGAPPSVSEAQSLFQERCRSAGDWPTFNLSKMAIWAWKDVGSRKVRCPCAADPNGVVKNQRQGSVLPAKSVRVAIYCLGADVELSISLKPPSGVKRETSVVQVKLDEAPPLDCIKEKDRPEGQSGGDHAEEKRIKEEDDVSQMDMGLPYLTSRANQMTGGRLRGNEIGKDPLFITLVHGDMLLFEGADFEVCPHRALSARRFLLQLLYLVYPEKDWNEYRCASSDLLCGLSSC